MRSFVLCCQRRKVALWRDLPRLPFGIECELMLLAHDRTVCLLVVNASRCSMTWSVALHFKSFITMLSGLSAYNASGKWHLLQRLVGAGYVVALSD